MDYPFKICRKINLKISLNSLANEEFVKRLSNFLQQNRARQINWAKNKVEFNGRGVNLIFLGNPFDLIETGELVYRESENAIELNYRFRLKLQVALINIIIIIL